MIKERTCVICKKKANKEHLCRFILLNNEIVIDLNHKINCFGYYFCKDNNCYESIKKWMTKKKRKIVSSE
ncbi:MAG: DUF448 domain-containing protein [Candidatus Cloacimonetes bacterium]|nr:DUF448 domain-containing protein [Candidatus Cloacimonadota bacterium]